MTPAAILLDQLAVARLAGATFDQAWPEALAAAVLAAPDSDRAGWADALTDTAQAWRRAWQRSTLTEAEGFLALLADNGGRLAMAERECQRCGSAIPEDRGRTGGPPKYCSEACRQAAAQKRAKLAHAAA